MLTAVHMTNNSSLNNILVYHCIMPLQDYYAEDLTGVQQVSLGTMNLINNHD